MLIKTRKKKRNTTNITGRKYVKNVYLLLIFLDCDDLSKTIIATYTKITNARKCTKMKENEKVL